MFQNFANYLLGSVTNYNEQGATAEGVEDNSNRLRSLEDKEDDWVLVDRDSEGNSDASSVASFDLRDADDRDDDVARPNITRASSTSSLPYTGMEESWFLTPPPCFTSAGPIHMETSPLENLLIEHPSMSVYHSHAHRKHFGRSRSPSIARDDLDLDDFEVEEIEEVAVVHHRAQRAARTHIIHVAQQQERQKIKSKHAQKVQMQKACESMKRGHLDRNNKAREVNGRNRRQRRGERSQGANRSHANNNRKC